MTSAVARYSGFCRGLKILVVCHCFASSICHVRRFFLNSTIPVRIAHWIVLSLTKAAANCKKFQDNKGWHM